MKTPIKLETFQGHIILYCKNHYKVPEGDKGFFEGLKMIWAIRCGYDYKLTGKDTLIYVANDMYKIIAKCQPERLPHLMEQLHREVGNQAFYKPIMTPIEAIIWEYRSIISNMTVKEKVGKRYKPIIELPKPMKRVFNRVLRGNGEYKDYYLIEPKT